MAFTTAGTATVSQRGRQQFQGLFTDFWAVKITGVDPANVAAAGEDTQTYTVSGVQLGDMILDWSYDKDITVDGDIEIWVSAANTITIRISNLNAASGLNYASGGTFYILVGRPGW